MVATLVRTAQVRQKWILRPATRHSLISFDQIGREAIKVSGLSAEEVINVGARRADR
jgi:hypothetical protein